MDLSKVKDDKKLELCRRYAKGGIALLPFLWVVNFVWFFNDAFRRPSFEEQKDIRKCLGALVWIVGMTSWVATFQTHRIEWGDLGDQLSFIVPTGSP